MVITTTIARRALYSTKAALHPLLHPSPSQPSVRALLLPTTTNANATKNDASFDLAALCTLTGLPVPTAPESSAALQRDLDRFLTLAQHMPDTITTGTRSTTTKPVSLQSLMAGHPTPPAAADVVKPGTYAGLLQATNNDISRLDRRSGRYLLARQVVVKSS